MFNKKILVGAVINRGSTCWYRVDDTRCAVNTLRVCTRNETSGARFSIQDVVTRLSTGAWSFAKVSPVQDVDLRKEINRVTELNKTNEIVEETNMQAMIKVPQLTDTAVTTVPVVFGTVITPDTPDSFFIQLMRDLKGQIDALDDVLDSEKMNAKRAELIKRRDIVVKLFDSRV